MTSGDGKADNSLYVKICGETVKVYADEGPEYIQRMANYINYIVDEFNAKKGHSVRQSLLLVYAALEICSSLFSEKDKKMTASERNYEKMFHMEVFGHKKTQDALEDAKEKLANAETEIAHLTEKLDEAIKEAARKANKEAAKEAASKAAFEASLETKGEALPADIPAAKAD